MQTVRKNSYTIQNIRLKNHPLSLKEQQQKLNQKKNPVFSFNQNSELRIDRHKT